MKAIGYFNKESDTSIDRENFTDKFNEYCQTHQHRPLSIYFNNEDQAGAQEQLSLLKKTVAEEHNGVLIAVIDATHIGKDLEAIARQVISFEGLNSEFICMSEEYPDILQNAFVHLGTPGVSKQRSAKIRESMQLKAMEGRVLGKPPFGYIIGEEGNFEVVPEEAPTVLFIFDSYTSGNLGLRKIVQSLKDKGITTRRGRDWNIVTIRDMLKNRTYIGPYQRFGLTLPRNHPAIVSTEIFRSAQDKVRERRRYKSFPDSSPFLLSNLCICGYCGSNMIGATRRQTWTKDSGERAKGTYRYYQCQSKSNRENCSYHTRRATELESIIYKQLLQLANTHELHKSMEGSSGETKRQIAGRKRFNRVESAEKLFIKSMKRTSRGESVTRRMALYLHDLDMARDQLFVSFPSSEINKVLNDWDDLSFNNRQAFLREHINSIIVKDRSVRLLI